jgi:peptidoglycan hydrolase-like protein with peptidoglycan-binding domain
MGMRVLILALSVLTLSVLGVLVSVDAANANPSTTTRELSASVEPATSADEATQASQKIQATPETEGQIGLDKRKRRDVQRRLSGLGFDTKINGTFDEQTRASITRWQAARGYPQTGFLDKTQHEALLTEFVSAAQASSSSDKSGDGHPAGRSGGSGARHHRSGGGGPGGLIGGVVGGLFGRR